jgi:hypothetical protein
VSVDNRADPRIGAGLAVIWRGRAGRADRAYQGLTQAWQRPHLCLPLTAAGSAATTHSI